MKLEGGFLVLYNAMAIKRIKEPRLHYKQLAEGKVDNKSRMRISNLKSYQDIDELVKIYVNEIHKNPSSYNIF